MGALTNRSSNYREKKQENTLPTYEETSKEFEGKPLVEEQSAADQVSSATSQALSPTPNPTDNITVQEFTPSAPSWVTAGSYEEAVKSTPKLSRADYIHGVSKHRRDQGLPDMDLREVNDVLQGRDPYETEEQRLKREKRMRTAQILTGVGDVLGNLVNYVRARNGNPAMDLSGIREGYNRIDRIRQGQQQLANVRAKEYLDALERDRTQRVQEGLRKAQQEQAERAHQLEVQRLKIKMNSAKSDAERKAFADALKKAEFEWKVQKENAQLKETERTNRARETTANARVYRDDYKVATSAMDSDGNTWTRNSPLSKEEAMRLVMSSDAAKDQSFLDGFRATTTTTNEEGETIRKGDVNWFEAAAQLMADKRIPSYVLSEMGYKGKEKAPNKYDQYKQGNTGSVDYSQFKE
jgi:hypothetical protein